MLLGDRAPVRRPRQVAPGTRRGYSDRGHCETDRLPDPATCAPRPRGTHSTDGPTGTTIRGHNADQHPAVRDSVRAGAATDSEADMCSAGRRRDVDGMRAGYPGPGSSAVPAAPENWDRSQYRVISAAPDARLLVDAGPGTGKTAVACARVSTLIDRDYLEPGKVWLISFTRTAVREMRDRIASYLEDRSAAYAVTIATLDSHAWSLHSGFGDGASILGSYNENIDRVLELVCNDADVADYLEGVEHLVVDEAQDLVGNRADLVVEIIRNLSPECGVTVFADEAQAIYGFADDRETTAADIREPTLPARLRAGRAGFFRECGLTTVHRTDSPNLVELFAETRRTVLALPGASTDKLDQVRSEVLRLADGEAPRIGDPVLGETDDAFLLFRRRCDVLLASSFLSGSGIAHRVRMSGLPACLDGWIGAALSEFTGHDLTRERFRQFWDERVRSTPLATSGSATAWGQLVRIAGRTRSVVEMRALRSRLGRSQPPAELCSGELGNRGPVVGTIHAAKGREADTVYLMLPYRGNSEEIGQDEEARVVFVGATRARARLLTGRGYKQFARRADASARAYSPKIRRRQAKAQVEIGCDGDIRTEGLAGRRFFHDAAAVHESQAAIRGLAEGAVGLVAVADPEINYRYRLREDGSDSFLAVLSKSVNRDLFRIAEALAGRRMRPPHRLHHLRVLGVRTLVLPPDSPESEVLHEPWRSSGILMAPLLLGYTTVTFRRYRRRR